MRFLRLLLFLACAAVSSAATYTWSGAAGDGVYSNAENWADHAVPPNDGASVVVFGNAPQTMVVLPPALNVGQIQFQNTAGTDYAFSSGFLTLLTVQNGIVGSPAGGKTLLGSNVTVHFSGNQAIQVASGQLEIAGLVLGYSNLTKTGQGTLRLSGINLMLGDTQVDAGRLIFAHASAVPPAGHVRSDATGYVGAENQAALKSLLGQLHSTGFAGTIGLETAPGSSSPAVFSDQIDVSNLANYSGIGSASSARLIGNLRVNSGQDYRFGGGGGTLFVETNLTSHDASLLISSPFGQPLKVVLRGSNNYNGDTQVLNSLLVLDSHQAVTSGKPLNLVGPGYIGATENFGASTSGFLSLVNPSASALAIVGFDSAASPRTISSAIDLSVGGTRQDPYYLGTSSKVTLTGAITPTVGDSLYLTAVKGGHLVVASTLGSNIPGLVVGQANSFDPQGGTVEIKGQNSFTGGTKVKGGNLLVSNNAALGLGSVAVENRATLTIGNKIVFSNPFSLQHGARLAGSGTIASPGHTTIVPGAIVSAGGAGHVGTLSFTNGLTLAAGAIIEFDIRNLNGSPGSGWDLLNLGNSAANIGGSALSPITIQLTSLTPLDTPGFLSGFNTNDSYSWLFLATGNVHGFSSDKFSFDTSSFANALNGGSFFVSHGNAGLSINFTPVPEPSTYVLLALGLGVVAIWELRRRKK